jgi:hypothetical protein
MAALDHFRRNPLWYAAQRLLYPVGIEKVARGLHARSTSVDQMVDSLLGTHEKEFNDMNDYQTVNPELLGLARNNIAQFAKPLTKEAFVPGGDPAMAAGPGGGGAPPGGDPMAGGMPPGGDPMAGGAPPGGDPMAGGMPPGGDPMAGGGDPMAMLQPMIQQAVQQAMAAQGGGGGAGGPAGAGAGLKPKIDVNVEIMQMKKLLAKLCDAMGVAIPAQDMVATPEDLNEIAAGGPGAAAATPDAGGGGSAIKPIEPMQAAAPEPKAAGDNHRQQGTAFDNPFGEITNRAQAILAIRGRRSA